MMSRGGSEQTLDELSRIRQATPSLKAAVRRARIEDADRSEVVAELRGAEIARLEMLQAAIEPVLAETPDEIDLFDVGLAPGDRPRLFIDMVGFVEMARDRRHYRFIQNMRHGRVLIAESESLDAMRDAVTAYIARRLVEREKALAADSPFELADAPARLKTPATSHPAANAAVLPGSPAETGRTRQRGLFRKGLRALVELVGSLVLILLVAAIAWFAFRFALDWWTGGV
jgi:hypothetical protein